MVKVDTAQPATEDDPQAGPDVIVVIKTKNIDAWLKQLDEVRLPIASHHHEAVRRVLLDSRRSLREIAEQMQESPAIALAMLREANRSASSFSGCMCFLRIPITYSRATQPG